MTYTKDQLKKWSGGSKIRTTYKVPTIKFNGNTGKIMKYEVGDYKTGVEIAEPVITILRLRRVYTSFEKMPDKSVVRMFTNEHNSWEDQITIFEAKTGKNIRSVGYGTIETLRAEFPTLRINSHAYCLYDGVVHRLVIKGKGRQALVEKQKELARDNFEFFEKNIKITPNQESGPGGNVYYFMKFEVVGDSDLEVVGPHLETIGKIMDKMDAEYVETNKRMKKEADILTGGVAGEEEDVDDIVPLEEAADEIKPEDVPF